MTSFAEIQMLLQSAFHGDSEAVLELLTLRVCPCCGRSSLNVQPSEQFNSCRVQACCFRCGWTHPDNLLLSIIPQSMLEEIQSLDRDLKRLKTLVRSSALAGALVESSSHRLVMHSYREVTFSRPAVEAVLSADDFEWLEQRLPRTDVHTVQVANTSAQRAPIYSPTPAVRTAYPMCMGLPMEREIVEQDI